MKKYHFKILTYAFWLSLAAIGGIMVVSGSLYLYLSPKLPSVESLRSIKLQTPLRVYSQDSQLIGEFGEKRRTPIAFAQIPPLYVKALLSAEDDRFYQHGGVDIAGLLRAASQLITSGEIKSGGSTITMQVARNFFLSHKQTFTRKFNEILLALRIEDDLSKDEILALYANKIYQGNRAYGIEAAANVYYGKSINELNLAQLAMIAGLPKAPSAYNPIANPARALTRRNWILRRMHNLGYINKEELLTATSEPVTANYHGYELDLDAPYIAEMARRKIVSMLGESAYMDGYKVYTTANSQLQRQAQQAILTGLFAYDQRHGYRGPEAQIKSPQLWAEMLEQTPTYQNLIPAIVAQVDEKSLHVLLESNQKIEITWENGLKGLRKYNSPNSRSAPIKAASELFSPGDLIRVEQTKEQWTLSQLPKVQAAIVALNPEDGGIQALVGGFDFRQSHFNRATQAKRQPGSNFKPFIYTTALENGFTAASIINDAPVVFADKLLENTWRPENDNGKFYGPTRLRKALYLSRNLVSIRVLRSLGIDTAIKGLERFGFDTEALPRNLSLALGTNVITPLELATGYAILANGGYQVAPYLVARIEDADANIIYQASPLTVCRDCKDSDINITSTTVPTAISATNELQVFADTALTSAETDLNFSAQEISAKKPVIALPRPIAPRVIEARVAYIIDSILKDVIQKGTGRRARVLERSDLSGKTGTTNGPKDAWFSGYSPHIITTTWLGFDSNLSLGRNEYGGSAALPIWIDFMKDALKGKSVINRPQPEGIVMVRIDPNTGLRVKPDHANAIFEIFRQENIPAMSESRPAIYLDETPSNTTLPEDLF